jgi:hypothetical protein
MTRLLAFFAFITIYLDPYDEEWLNLGASLDDKFETMEAHLCQIEREISLT